MKVYVCETGCYENRGVSGVYVSLEAAIAEHPIPGDFPYQDEPTDADHSRRGGWIKKAYHDGESYWTNQLDWDWCAEIHEYELVGN